MKPLIAGAVFASCAALGVLAGACNALSGIDNFEVAVEAGRAAGPDEGVSEGSSEGGPLLEGGGADVGSADGAGEGEAGTVEGASGDAGTDSTDGAGQAGGDGAIDAGNETGSCAVSTPLCDAGCPTAHSNGLGQTFYDCTPLGTMNETQALEACVAFTASGALCANDPIGCANADEVCSSGASTCACWNYRGSHVGKVFATTTTTCSCYVGSAPSWD